MTTTTTIDPQMTMRELTERFSGAQRALFTQYHIGGCASCGFRPDETLAEVCARNENLAVSEVAAHILASHEADLKLRIEPKELAAQLANGEAGGAVKVVDIRTREEFDAARIEGAIFFTQELMQSAMSEWDRAALMVFVDHHSARSMDAAAYFAGHGFTNVRSLRGGMDAWSAEVDPNVPRYHLE